VWRTDHDLEPNTRYTVEIAAPADGGDPYGIRAFDGAVLENKFTFSFMTGDEHTPLDEPNRDGPFCQPQDGCYSPANPCDPPDMASTFTDTPNNLLMSTCAESGQCHGPPDDPANPPTGLVGRVFLINDGGGNQISAYINRVATETAGGPNPILVNRGSAAVGQDMPFIDPTNPANSYLLYKMLLRLAETDPTPRTTPAPIYKCASVADAGNTAVDAGTDASADAGDASLDAPGDAADASLDAPGDALADVASDSSTDADAATIDDGAVDAADATTTDAPTGAPGASDTCPVAFKKDDALTSAVQPWIPEAMQRPPAAGEYERLRAFVRGAGMPYQRKTNLASMRAMSAWIAHGAHVEACQ
jgi:hypothetical protein